MRGANAYDFQLDGCAVHGAIHVANTLAERIPKRKKFRREGFIDDGDARNRWVASLDVREVAAAEKADADSVKKAGGGRSIGCHNGLFAAAFADANRRLEAADRKRIAEGHLRRNGDGLNARLLAKAVDNREE